MLSENRVLPHLTQLVKINKKRLSQVKHFNFIKSDNTIEKR